MGCARLAVGEDSEALELARELQIPYREALNRVISQRLQAAMGSLVNDRARMEFIQGQAEGAAIAALHAAVTVDVGGYTHSDLSKGDFGESCTALDFFSRGFEPISFGGHGNTGIDSIWVREGVYYVVESKSFGADLAPREYFEWTLASGQSVEVETKPAQMSHQWIVERLEKAVGGDKILAEHIAEQGYARLVHHSGDSGGGRIGYLPDA